MNLGSVIKSKRQMMQEYMVFRNGILVGMFSYWDIIINRHTERFKEMDLLCDFTMEYTFILI